jgi:23S rRNA pseudouridine2605 synthase
LILDGRVRLNGAVVTLGQTADPMLDAIEVDGQVLLPVNRPQALYLLMHKPAGVVSTCRDPQRRSTVLDQLPPELRQAMGIHPVGRLDAESTGALLLTNDGALTFALTHPSHEIAKTYEVWVQGHPSPNTLHQWREGVLLDGRKTLPARVRVVSQRGDRTLLEIHLREGRNRQIRRVAEQMGHPVVDLHRTAIGSIQLGDLPSGAVRPLTEAEIQFLKNQGQESRRTFPKSIAKYSSCRAAEVRGAGREPLRGGDTPTSPRTSPM